MTTGSFAQFGSYGRVPRLVGGGGGSCDDRPGRRDRSRLAARWVWRARRFGLPGPDRGRTRANPAICPRHLLQLAIGVLLLLFGSVWLRKAILRAARGVIPLHDEARAFAAVTAELHEQVALRTAHADWLAAIASLKAVLLEGLEVVFIVIAVSAGRGLLVPASVSAVAACLLVAGVGFVVHPLARAGPREHAQISACRRIAVGVRLVLDREGLGVPWPGADLAIVAFIALFVALGFATIALARRPDVVNDSMSALSAVLREIVLRALRRRWLAGVGDPRNCCVGGNLRRAGANVPLLAGAVLLIGCLAVLIANVLRARRR